MMKEIIDFKYLDKGKDQLNKLRHNHGESYEILLVRSGSGSFMVRDRLFPLTPGAVYFINGIDTHYSAPEKPDEYMRGKLIISGGFIDGIARITGCSKVLYELFHKNGGTCFTPNDKVASYIDAQFSAINHALTENTIHTNINVVSAVFNILSAAYSNKGASAPVLDNHISKALEYINNNLNSVFSLEDICEHISVSKYYLCHKFKKIVGMTVGDYALSRRISVARKYLRSSDMTISEVAEKAGFSSFSYFSKIVKQYEGVTPSEFRKNGSVVPHFMHGSG